MNKLLERQIRNYLNGVDISSQQIQDFFKAVSEAYDAEEVDRKLMERSIEISSKEMIELNDREREEAASNKEAITILKTAVDSSLANDYYAESIKSNESVKEVIRLAHFLGELVIKYQQNVNELTEQKNHSDILSHELQTFKLAVDDAADFISFFDEDMKFIYANKAAISQIGLGDIIGRTVSEIFSTFTPNNKTNEIVQHIANGDETFVSDLTLPGKLNEPTIIEIVTTIIRDAHERKIAINIGRDITKERSLENEKDEFVSIASHELRTPMTVIRGFINLLDREQLGTINDEQRTVLRKMSHNTSTLIDLVNDMLDLSKLEANKSAIQIVDKPIDQLINNSIEKIRILFDSKGISLSYLGGHININTDVDKFERIMLNLLSNACKFTQQGGSVTVTTTANEDGQHATICVADTGVGIPSASIDNLFKKFSQVDNVLHRQIGGTGLGLAICKELVDKLGGTIWVDSQPNIGSKFYFTMPMTRNNDSNTLS
jgi:PAS domain S-box-containing protein